MPKKRKLKKIQIKKHTCLKLHNNVACFIKTDKFIILFFRIFKKI